jgi:hypothetical protein
MVLSTYEHPHFPSCWKYRVLTILIFITELEELGPSTEVNLTLVSFHEREASL